MNSIVAKVKAGIDNGRFTQPILADASGVAQATISRIYNQSWDRANGEYRPRLKPATLAKVKRGLARLRNGAR